MSDDGDEMVVTYGGAGPGGTCFADVVAVDGEIVEGTSRFHFGSSAHALGGHHPDPNQL